MARSSTSQFTVRLEDGLRSSLEESAKTHQRSLQVEIVTRLLESLGVRNDTDAKIEQIARRIFHEEAQRMGLTKEAQDQ